MLLLLATAGRASGPAWRAAAPGYPWSFPRDHAAHPRYRNEWWYLTGHLRSRLDPSRRFGVQFTLFRVGLTPEAPPASAGRWGTRALVMGHAALSDPATGRHRFSELTWRTMPLLGGFAQLDEDDSGLPEPRLAWALAPAGTEGRWTIDWNGEGFDCAAHDATEGFGFRLSTRPRKPLVFQGPGGLSRKSGSGGEASLYYSMTRLDTAGTIHLEGERIEVLGESWFDKEFGSGELAADQVGWDWVSLQLEDGRELMLYLLRRADGSVSHAQGSLVEVDGSVRFLAPAAFRIRATGSWTSPATGARYPSGWTLSVPESGLELSLSPLVPAAENVSRLIDGLAYWEGPVAVTDTRGGEVGRGYVELTGYGGTRRPSR